MSLIALFRREFTGFLLLNLCFTLSLFSQTQDYDSILRGQMKLMNIPAMSITIIKNGAPIYSDGIGVDGYEGIISDATLFQAASLSKFPTALLFLLNQQKETLDLEDNVNLYLKSHHLSARKSEPDVIPSISELLSQTGGLNISGFLGYKRSKKNIPTIENVLDSKYTFLWEPKVKITSQVNGRYRYSGGGYSYLQKMIMDFKGDDFNNVMQRELFGSLGLTNSHYGIDPPRGASVAYAHNKKGKAIKGGYRVYPQEAAAGLWTTAEDYTQLILEVLKAFENDTASCLLKESSEILVQPTKTKDGNVNPYGLGVMLLLDTTNKAYAFEHSGRNVGYSSFFHVNLNTGDGFVILTNKHKTNFDVLNKFVKEIFMLNLENDKE